MSITQLNAAINWALSIAADDRYYYSQPSQLPFGMDCSTFVIEAFNYANVPTHGATYTGDMEQCFTVDNTFTSLTFDYSIAQRGDIFLKHVSGNIGHCCIYLGNGRIVHAANSSSGILEAAYYENGYQKILRLTDQTPVSYNWNAKTTGGYLKEDVEAQENAILIYSELSSYGWTLSAVCGFLGSVGAESSYNPWRWEDDIVISSTDSYNISDGNRRHGYGLVQFTPASKYVWNSAAQSMLNFSPNYSDVTGTPEDGRAQCEFINSFADYQPTSTYPQSYADYKAWTGTPEEGASIWLYNYERGGYATEQDRRNLARWWYDFLGGITPPTPTHRKKGLPIWLINKIVRKEF